MLTSIVTLLIHIAVDGKLDLIFAIDGSDAMGAANFDKAKKLMAHVVSHMRLGPESINFVIVVYNKENTFSIVEVGQSNSNHRTLMRFCYYS